MGIRSKLIFSICIPLLLIYVAVLTWDYFKSRTQAVRMIEQLVAQRASADAGQVNARLLTVQQTVDRAAYILAGRGGAYPGMNRMFAAGLGQTPWVEAVWVTFADARQPPFGVRRAAGERRPFDDFRPDAGFTDRLAKRVQAGGKPVWLDPSEVGPTPGQSACVFASPFYAGDDGKPLGVVFASVPAAALRYLREDTPVQSQLRRLMAGSRGVPQPTTDRADDPQALTDGGYLLIDRHGNILSRPDGAGLGRPLAVGPDDEDLDRSITRALRGNGEIVTAGGLNQTLGAVAPRARYVLAMEPLSSTGWLYVTAAAESDLLGPIQERLVSRALFLIGSLFVVVAILGFVITRFCRPIEQMAGTVRQLAAGSLDIAPVPVVANDELGQLARGFNDMTGRLRHHVRELTEQSVEREKVESELRIARQIQSDLLPRTFPPFPERQEFGLHAVNIPARHIAGDFFDFFFTASDRLIVVIADVSGKGVPAALMMAVTRTMVRNLAESGLSPCEIVERVNRMLVDDTTPGLFVTMMLGEYEPSSGRFTYVNAGHPAAISVTGGRAEACCAPTGPLLGVVSDGSLGPYEQQAFTLSHGTSVLLYTDGVTEAHDQTNVMFGDERLHDCVERFADKGPPELCEGVVSTVMAYQHQNAADDLTLVVLQRR